MTRRTVLAIAALVTLAAPPAGAVLDRGARPEAPSGGTSPPGVQLSPRQQAEAYYADAYDEIGKAKADLAGGRAKDAGKKLRRALDRGLRAAELDTTYHEAWNLVGYAARKLGDYDRSLAAYERCLRLRPDYAAAREYLGEAYVELGRLDDARGQLRWLERLGAKDEAGTLRAALEAAESKSVPAAAGPPGRGE